MSSSNPPQEGTDTDKTPTPTPSAPPKPFSMSLSSNGAAKKPTSFTLKSSSSATTAEPQPRRRGGQPHQHLNHHDSDSDPENDDPTHEAVTGFDTQSGTAISADSSERDKAKELVIPVASGNNWRDRPGVNVNVHGRRRGKKNLLPQEVQAIQEAREKGVDIGGGGGEEEGEGKLKFGITYAEKTADVDGEDKEMEMKDATAGPIVPPVVDERRPLTQDEIALRELVKESKGESEGRTDLVIQSKPAYEEAGDEGEGEEGGRYDETSSFRADIASRPESSSLDQYNSIPVEEFGAALLRGMGWKEGQAVGRGNYDTSATANRSITAPRIPERRPGFLGIGAKDLSGGKGAESEIGAWGKAAMRKGARKGGKEGGDGNTEGVYMPVMMRNRQTGEYITEEELGAARKEVKGRKGDDDEWKERRDRNLERSGRDRGDREYRKRDYENGDDYDRSSRRTGSSRRDRSLSPGDHSSRRRRYDDDDYSSGRDDRRDRERERERERRRDRDRDRSRKYRDDDRYSSRHSSSHSSRHRDRERDRERDRDSDRESYRRRHDR